LILEKRRVYPPYLCKGSALKKEGGKRKGGGREASSKMMVL
jgi:hypothetical protein